jgi:TRAP-type C4-dicarboxylate transport system substrate-binding protein
MYEVACCMALTKHLMDPTFLVFSLAEWKKLSPAEQAALQKAAHEAAKVVREMAPQREGEALAQVKKLGMKVNEIDLAPLQKAAVAAQNDLAKEFGAEKLLQQIRNTN